MPESSVECTVFHRRVFYSMSGKLSDHKPFFKSHYCLKDRKEVHDSRFWGLNSLVFILCADVSSNFYSNSLQLRVSVFKYIDKCDTIINPQKTAFIHIRLKPCSQE